MNDPSAMPEPDAPLLRFRVPVEPVAVRSVRKTIESFAIDHGFTARQVFDFSIAVSEALFNAMDHGGCNSAAASIDVEVLFRSGVIEIAVEDDGTFEESDPRCAELRSQLAGNCEIVPETDLERGRGLFLIRARSDAVRVERAQDGGMRVVMVKRR